MNETQTSRTHPSTPGPKGRSYRASLSGILILLALGLILAGALRRYPVSGNGEEQMSETQIVQAITVGGVAPETQPADQAGATTKIKETKGQDYCPT